MFFSGGGGSEILGVWVQLGGFEKSVRSRGRGNVNQVRNRTADNTLLMHIASNLYIKMVTLDSPGSCSTGIKVTLAELASPAKRDSPELMYEFYYQTVCT